MQATMIALKLPNQQYGYDCSMSDEHNEWMEWVTSKATVYDVELHESEYLDDGLWKHTVTGRARVDWGDWFRMKKTFVTLSATPPSKTQIRSDTGDWMIDEFMEVG
jgi:hypothetical protein